MTEPITIDFGLCTLTWIPDQHKCIAKFFDGTEAHACPHDTDAYRAHSHDKSTGDIDDYCWQHEIAHVVIGLIKGGPSAVLWNLAHGFPTDTPECEAEEQTAQEWQRKFFRRDQ